MNCPIATQNAKVNDENQKEAIKTAGYKESGGEYKCGNCAAFIETEEIESCIEEGLGEMEDAGYCSQLAFVCGEDMVCDKWLSGGPVTGKNKGIIIKIAGMMDE